MVIGPDIVACYRQTPVLQQTVCCRTVQLQVASEMRCFWIERTNTAIISMLRNIYYQSCSFGMV